MIKRKGINKGEIVKAIQSIEQVLRILEQRLSLIEIITDKYITMNGDVESLQEYMEIKESEESNTKK
jgi:hypothetical protein